MSPTVIFVVGVVVFALTVYGSVMAAGVAMTRVEIEQRPGLAKSQTEPDGDKTIPDIKY